MKIETKFDPLCPGLYQMEMQIQLNTTGQGYHAPEVEWIIHTTKNSTIYALYGSPFKKLPTMLTVGIIPETIFWVKTITSEGGVSRKMSLDIIVTERQLIYNKYRHLNFG